MLLSFSLSDKHDQTQNIKFVLFKQDTSTTQNIKKIFTLENTRIFQQWLFFAIGYYLVRIYCKINSYYGLE